MTSLTPVTDTVLNATVLIVDDEVPNVRLLERVLGGAGFSEVHTETDPRRVANLMDELKPDAVLLDLLMPYLDGFQVLDLIAAHKSDSDFLPVLVLTADVTRDARERALRAGASDFLTKPFDATEVILRLKNLLRTRHLHQQVQGYAVSLEDLVYARTQELRDSYEALKKSDVNRRELLKHLVRAQEDERARIAGDVHDDPIQQMTAVGMRLEILQHSITDPEQLELTTNLIALVQGAVSRLRHLLFQLRPPSLDTQGLAAALRDMLRIEAETAGFRFELEDQLTDEPPEETRIVLYRVAQEAVTNARKHAGAKALTVQLGQADARYTVTVKDDGKGFDTEKAGQPQPGHLGLLGMVERATLAGGGCDIQSRPGEGTEVTAWVPATQEAASGGNV